MFRISFLLPWSATISLLAFPLTAVGQGGLLKLHDEHAVWAAAGKSGKLVLVAHVTGPHDQKPFASRGYRLLQQALTHDDSVLELMRTKFEVSVRQVENEKFQIGGKKSTLQSALEEPNSVTYFCRPDGRVLHFIIGIPSTRCLENEARWALRIADDCKKTFLPPETVVRSALHESLGLAAVQRFRERYKGTLWFDQRMVRAATDADIYQVTLAAIGARLQMLTQRFGDPNNFAMRQRLLYHPDVGTSIARMVLAEVPLVPLEKLQVALFHGCLRRLFTGRAQTATASTQWIKEQWADGKAVLLEVTATHPVGDPDGWLNFGRHPFEAKQLRADDQLQKLSSRFEQRQISQAELAYALGELKVPMIKLPHGSRLVAVAVNRHRRVTTIHSRISPSTAAKLLARVKR